MTGPEAREFEARVLSVREECRDVRTLRLSAPAGFTFKPGQWVMVHFPSEPKHARAYSIASSPLETGYFELTLAKVGELSARLHALPAGASVLAKGPYGKWVLDDRARHAVLISGGTGLTPFRAMTRYALEKGAPKVTIIYSAKTPADILYREELEEFGRRGVKVLATVTRPEPGDGWSGRRGRLDLDTIEREVGRLGEAWYFLCGPNSLVRDFAAGLESRGVPREHIRTEKWGDY